MNKAQLIRQIVASLTESLGVLEKAARASHAEATHESSMAESKYDMRAQILQHGAYERFRRHSNRLMSQLEREIFPCLQQAGHFHLERSPFCNSHHD
jgi:hypothetical protein